MIAIVQRVSRASVAVDGEIKGQIGKGFMVLLGIAKEDGELDARLLADKISKLRIFTGSDGKFNLSVNDIGGSLLIVPNFTLLASYRKGNRPDFFNGAAPEEANRLFEYFVGYISGLVSNTQKGVFGAHMEVELVNDGPVTISMDSNVLKKKNS